MPQHACPLSCVRNHSITACVYIAHRMRVTGVVHTCTLPHMHSHSIVARVWLVTGVRVPCRGEDSVVAATHCFSAIPDSLLIPLDELSQCNLLAERMANKDIPASLRTLSGVRRPVGPLISWRKN